MKHLFFQDYRKKDLTIEEIALKLRSELYVLFVDIFKNMDFNFTYIAKKQK